MTITFVVQPFHITKDAVQFQLFVDSETRMHGFVGINSMTKAEWDAFRSLLESGAKTKANKDKNISVSVHLAFEKVD